MLCKRIESDGTEKNSKIINACCAASKDYVDYNNNFNRFYEVDESMLFAVNCNSHVAYRFIQRSDYSSLSNMNVVFSLKDYIIKTVMDSLTLNEETFWEVLGYKTVWIVKKYTDKYDAFCLELKPHYCGGINVNTIYIKTYIQKLNYEKLRVGKKQPIFEFDTINNIINLNPKDIRTEI